MARPEGFEPPTCGFVDLFSPFFHDSVSYQKIRKNSTFSRSYRISALLPMVAYCWGFLGIKVTKKVTKFCDTEEVKMEKKNILDSIRVHDCLNRCFRKADRMDEMMKKAKRQPIIRKALNQVFSPLRADYHQAWKIDRLLGRVLEAVQKKK
jgi:hypothetical protein